MPEANRGRSNVERCCTPKGSGFRRAALDARRPSPARGAAALLSPFIAGMVAVIAWGAWSGCGQPITGSGYLGAYADMKANRYLEAESHLPWLRIDREAVLLVQPVQAYFYRGRRPVAFPRLARAFQEALVREIGNTQLFARVQEGSTLMVPVDADWALHAVLTEVDLGLPDSNLEPGVSYRGARRVGVEGKITDVRGARTLFKFKDARMGPPDRGLSPSEADVEAELLRDLNAIARGVADSLRQIHAESIQVSKPVPPSPQTSPPEASSQEGSPPGASPSAASVPEPPAPAR